jgi:hypothetical protein
VWLIVLSDQLPIVALVSAYPTSQLIGRGLLLWRPLERGLCSVCAEPMRSCRRFLAGIPHRRVDDPRVAHPSATPSRLRARAFDLHVLGTPPAFILSQDQTRHPMICAQSRLHDSERGMLSCDPGQVTLLLGLFAEKLWSTSLVAGHQFFDRNCSFPNSCCSAFHSSIVKVSLEAIFKTASVAVSRDGYRNQ